MPTDLGPSDTKHDDLRSLRIDRSLRDGGGEPPAWSRRFILGGIAVVVLLGIAALAYRALASETPEVEVARATAEGSDVAGSTVLSASGYIVAHHKISVNSKVTGRVAWIGVEKGDKVKEGQVLVRFEDEEYRAQYEQARGAVESAKARLLENAARIAPRRNPAGGAQSLRGASNGGQTTNLIWTAPASWLRRE